MRLTLLACTAALTLAACGPAGPGIEKIEDKASEAIAEAGNMTTPIIEGTPTAGFADDGDVITASSGLQYKVIQAGLENGATAAPGQGIAAHYHGFFPDGSVFDSSYKRGSPLTGPSNGFIKGWNEALGEMKVCEARTLSINSDLAYGDDGRGSIPGGATLMFHMQLLAIQKTGESDDVFECPKDKILTGPEAY